jgi:hypothetical protein
MKKIYEILAVACILTIILPVTAIAEASDSDVDVDSEENELEIESTEALNEKDPVMVYDSSNCVSYKAGKIKDKYQSPRHKDLSKRSVIFKGIWGFSGDNESDGYFGGKIVCGNRVRILKGFYNKTDNETKGRVIGILKNGFFNGKIIGPDGVKYSIVGLFRVNKEDKTLKMKWMTPYNSGWAAARLDLKE